MPRLTLNDLEKQGLLHVDGATGNDIISSTDAGAIRIMGVLIANTVAVGTISIEDAATFAALDIQVRCLIDDSNYVSFAPYGWRVTNVSTSTTGQASIFYILDE